MKTITVTEKQFDEAFLNTIEKLQLTSLREGTIDVNLNSQVEVNNFINQLHRKFHYEVVQLKKKLEEI